MSFPAYLDIIVEIQVGSGGEWVDISEDRRVKQNVRIQYGRPDEASDIETATMSLVINNRHGKYSVLNPNSPYFGSLNINTPIRISLSIEGEVHYRFTGSGASWPTKWDLSGNDIWVTVEASGMLRILAGSKAPERSALRRFIEFLGPVAYWAMDDGETAIQGLATVGPHNIRAVGTTGALFGNQPSWGKGSLAPWIDNNVLLPKETEGNLRGNIETITDTEWSADMYRSGPGGEEDDFTVFDIGEATDANPIVGWILIQDRVANTVELFVLTAGETTSSISLLSTISNPGIFDYNPHMLRLRGVTNGTSTDWYVYIDGVLVDNGTHAIPFRPASRIRWRWGAFSSLLEDMSIGHFTFWGEGAPSPAWAYNALLGHQGELAGRRIERLCEERAIPFEVHGDLDQTPPCGPQQTASFLTLLKHAEAVDGGTLGESRSQLGLTFRTQRSKYNQEV
jgi:hypothetical protein